MSSAPTGSVAPSMAAIFAASRRASVTPRVRRPTKVTSAGPLLRSRISWAMRVRARSRAAASRTSVFSRSFGGVLLGLIGSPCGPLRAHLKERTFRTRATLPVGVSCCQPPSGSCAERGRARRRLAGTGAADTALLRVDAGHDLLAVALVEGDLDLVALLQAVGAEAVAQHQRGAVVERDGAVRGVDALDLAFHLCGQHGDGDREERAERSDDGEGTSEHAHPPQPGSARDSSWWIDGSIDDVIRRMRGAAHATRDARADRGTVAPAVRRARQCVRPRPAT